MRLNSKEVCAAVEAQGGEPRVCNYGHSYRAGGVIFITPKGWWDNPVPVRVDRAVGEAFDGTGYDGRGRHYEVVRLAPDNTKTGGFLRVSAGEFTALAEADRVQFGSDHRSGNALYFGRKSAAVEAVAGFAAGLMAGMEAFRPSPVVVTRHPALVDLLMERGLIGPGAKVITHATPDDVHGQDVIGVLPLSLAALANSVTELPLAITPEMRGKELDLETLRQIAGDAVKYRVQYLPKGNGD
jgi:putative CRISPR-associated protein (TIGR02620 family)